MVPRIHFTFGWDEYWVQDFCSDKLTKVSVDAQ